VVGPAFANRLSKSRPVARRFGDGRAGGGGIGRRSIIAPFGSWSRSARLSVGEFEELVEESDDEFHGFADYTAEELLEQARANAQAAIMATALFLHRKGIPLSEWAAALGETFSLAWDAPRPWEAGEFLDAMLTNLRALGADVVSSDLGIDRAEAVTTGFPDLALCELFGIDPALVVAFNDSAAKLAADRGLTWTWTRERDRVRYTVRQNET
jgi:hypothetical protein